MTTERPTRDGYNIIWRWWDAQDLKGIVITESGSDWYMTLVVEESCDFAEIALNSSQARELARQLLIASDEIDEQTRALTD